jgi:mandelate racemase
MTESRLTVRAIRARGVDVPMRFVLGTSATAVRSAPLLLVDLDTDEGITGRTYLFCYLTAAAPAIVSLLAEVERVVKGQRIEPAALWAKLSLRFRLIGVQGIVRMAMSAFDTASWDALAIAAGMPLVRYLGGELQRIAAYNSCGLGLMAPDALADEAEKLLANGFRAIKLRLGYSTLAQDMSAVRAVRTRVGDAVDIMVDFNQAHDDYRGCATLASELKTPIQIGENFSEPRAMTEALDAGACDYVMPDLERIGGVTGWQAAASIASQRGIRMSSHLFPEVSSHLLAVTPTAHWLEYVDWADAIVEEPLAIIDGHAVIPDRAGNGLVWNEDKVARYRIR